MYFFDTHAHIHRAPDGRRARPLELLKRARKAGVRAVLVPAVTPHDWDQLPQLQRLPGIELYFSWGLHPYFVSEITPAEARDQTQKLRERVKHAPSRMRAIGECGLDFARARDVAGRELQVEVLRAHLDLARDTGLPLTLHCVRAHGPLLELLRARPLPPSVLHAFSGSAEVGHELTRRGHYLAFAGNACLAAARRVVAAVRATPGDRLLLETDTPDQTPPPRRPAANEPAFIVDIAARVAELRGEAMAAVAASTLENGRRAFALTEPFALHPWPEDDGARAEPNE